MEQQLVRINLDRKTVTKEYRDHKEAEKHFLLFSHFHHHAIPIAVHKNTLTYHYVDGVELKTLLSNPGDKLTKKSIVYLARSLSKNHSNYIVRPIIYSDICSQRRPTEKHHFAPSGYYTGTIHGDLNTKNIIIARNGKPTFIDRYCENGDIMFDFTFIMSLLCLYAQTRNKEYLRLVTLFWKSYDPNLKDRDDFFASLRNNFINYGSMVAEDAPHHASFPEWKYGRHVSEWLTKYKTFSEFLLAKLGQ